MKEVISASRRTDLPRWYLKETIDALKRGSITLNNPFNKQNYMVNLRPDDVSVIIWWSKDFSVWLAERERNPSFFAKYNHYFQFTLNGYTDPSIQKLLERGVTSTLAERLTQLQHIAKLYTPFAINWRFDPIVYWNDDGSVKNNTADFETIAEAVSIIGISRCTIAFCDWNYKKAEKRAINCHPDHKMIFIKPSLETMKTDAERLAKIAQQYGIKLYSCANHAIVDDRYVFASHCIDGETINKLYCSDASTTKDAGQREMCGCTKSRDIGSYEQQCYNSCIYCYANGV